MRGWTHLLLIAAVISVLFPVFLIFTAAFRTTFIPPQLIPAGLTTKNFEKLFSGSYFPLWAINTIIICLGTILLTLACICPAAYALSRMRFWGRRELLLFLVIAQMFPSLVGMVAIYKILTTLRLVNLLGLILIYTGTGAPFYTWFLKGYMDTLPYSLDESAQVDGAGPFRTFSKIILPLSKPALGVICFMVFLIPYNDYILPSFLLEYPDTTLVAGLAGLSGIGGRSADYPLLAAGVMISSIPLLLVFLFFQRYFIAGLTRGAVR
ncbi:MAG: ABC transporter permease subunit [Candidatus Hadarchaeales archaeon]